MWCSWLSASSYVEPRKHGFDPLFVDYVCCFFVYSHTNITTENRSFHCYTSFFVYQNQVSEIRSFISYKIRLSMNQERRRLNIPVLQMSRRDVIGSIELIKDLFKMHNLVKGSLNKAAPLARSVSSLAARNLTEPLYPIIEIFKFDETLTEASYSQKINKLVDFNLFSCRGIKILPPFCPNSLNSFMQIKFETCSSNFVGLYCKSNYMPVSVLAGDQILVLDKELWKSVSDVYKKDMNVTEIGFSPYGVFENLFSFDLLESAVDFVAAMDFRNAVVFKASLSRVITMVSYACFWREVRQFVGLVLEVKGCSDELGDPLIRMMKDWGRVSRQVHSGVKLFELSELGLMNVNLGIKDLRSELLLMDSKVKEVEGELDPPVDKWLAISELHDHIGRFNLRVVVGDAEVVYDKANKEKMSIVEVRDSSGSAKIKAKNEEVDLLVEGTTVLLINVRIHTSDKGTVIVVGDLGSIVDDPPEEE